MQLLAGHRSIETTERYIDGDHLRAEEVGGVRLGASHGVRGIHVLARVGVRSMSDPFKELVEQMARRSVPEDDTEENQERREATASESGTQIRELDESHAASSCRFRAVWARLCAKQREGESARAY